MNDKRQVDTVHLLGSAELKTRAESRDDLATGYQPDSCSPVGECRHGIRTTCHVHGPALSTYLGEVQHEHAEYGSMAAIVELDVEAIEPIDISVRQFAAGDATTLPVGTWWWLLDVYGCHVDSRGALATADDARADAIEYLRKVRERIDLTLAALDAKAGEP